MTGLRLRATVANATTTGTPPVTQNFDASGGTLPNESPKAAFYFITSGLLINTLQAPYRFGIGVTDGTTQRSLGALAENGVSASTADAQTRTDNATVVQFPNSGSGALNGEARWSAWRTNGSELAWDDLLSFGNLVGALYFFGTEIKAFLVDLTTNATFGGTASITTCPFAPNLIFVLGTDGGFVADTDNDGLSHGFGFACKTPTGIMQGGSWVSIADRPSGGNASCAQSLYESTRVFRRVTASAASGSTSGASLEVSSFDPKGVTITTLGASEALNITVLCLRVPHKLWIGEPGIDTSTTGNATISGVGFTPQAYIWVGTVMTSTNTEVDAAQAGQISIGFHTGGEDGCIGAQAQDGVGTSNTISLLAADVANVPNDSGGTDWAASHVSFNSDGAVVNVDSASPSGRMSAVLMIGAGRNDFQWSPNTSGARRWRRSLARR